ncbi:MAG: hypothetical protein AAB567_02555 [Patescibacteria group bacterium]
MGIKLQRYKGNPILVPDKSRAWEAGAVFNPSVVFDKGIFHMVYRAVGGNLQILEGGGFKNYISSVGYAQSTDGIHFIKSPYPLIKPEYKWERFGCEDPRITKIANTYYIFYTAVSKQVYLQGVPLRIALSATKDFKTVRKYGIIGPNINSKDGVLFPLKINEKYWMLLTWHPDKLDASIAYAKFTSTDQFIHASQDYWKKEFLPFVQQRILLPLPQSGLRDSQVGAAPLKTKRGWLLIYCGSTDEWFIHAALLDKKNLAKIIAYSKDPLLWPEEEYERQGMVPNVTFPSGAAIVEDKLFVYYGAADTTCCLATCNLNDLLNSLTKKI